MACNSAVQSFLLAHREPVWSYGNYANQGQSAIFVLSGSDIAQLAPKLQQIRATVVLENSTPDVEVEVVLQSSDDGCAWDPPVVISAAWITADQKVTTPWHSTAANFKRTIRVGVRARQASAVTTLQSTRVTLTLDVELRC